MLLVIKEILANMNKGGRTQDHEEQMRRIMRDVMSEANNASASERDMMNRMMQLLEHNITKHSAELQATAQERDHYKAKMEELNRNMEQLMRDGVAPSSGGKDPELTDKQKRLAEIWEELQEMRRSKQSNETTQGKPFNKGGERGGSGARGARRPQYQSQHERDSFQFGGQNKDGTPFSPGEYPFSTGEYPSQGRDSEKLETSPHKDYKSGGFRSKLFQQYNRYQKGPMSSPETFTQHGGRDGRRDFVPFSGNTQDNHGFHSHNRHWQGGSGPGFSNRDAVQNVGMQNRFQQDNRYQEGPKTFTQHGGRDGRRDFVSFSGNTQDNHGFHSHNRHWQGDSGPGFSNRDAVQNAGMQNRFQQDCRYQEGPKTFTQHGGRDGRRDFVPFSSNTQDNHGFHSHNRQWQGDSGPGFSNRDAVQNVGMQNRGPSRGSYQHRARSIDRGQHQQRRGQCNPHRGQFHQHRGQSQDGRQGQRSFDSGSSNPRDDFSSSQFTPEEIEAIKSVLKQREAAAAEECTGKSVSQPLPVNPSEKAVKKEKEQKEPEGVAAVLPDDSESDDEDASKKLSGVAGETGFAKATDAKLVADSKKKKRNNNKGSKDQAAAQQKPEGLSSLEVFTASGFNMSQIAALNMDQAVKDLMLITKEDGNIVSCQPKTVRELVEFKQQYPNAQAIIVKASEQQ